MFGCYAPAVTDHSLYSVETENKLRNYLMRWFAYHILPTTFCICYCSSVVVCLVFLIVHSPHSIVCVGWHETLHGTQWKATYRHECSLSAAMQRLSVTLHRWTCIAHQPRSSYVTVLVFIFALHTLCPKKVYPSMFDNDFGKYGPIFKIFSLGDS